MPQSQSKELTIYTPPYAAYARPANELSMRVNMYANATKLTIPGTSHHDDLSIRNHAQNAKHPAISAAAAALKMASVCSTGSGPTAFKSAPRS